MAMKVKIAVCDDDDWQLKTLNSLLNEWNCEVEVKEYQSAEQFLFDYPDEDFQILLLDIEMRGMNGMELARKLRVQDDRIPIIFITGYPEFMQEGYDVEALHYLLKPVKKEKLYEILDKCVKLLNQSRQIVIPTKDGMMRIDTERIVYCEAFGKRTEIVTKEGEVFLCSLGIHQLSNQLGDAFVQCHRSYLIHLRFLKSIKKTSLMMDNGKELPLARRCVLPVNRAFIEYYK